MARQLAVRITPFLFAVVFGSGCAATESNRRASTSPGVAFDPYLYALPREIAAEDHAFKVEDRALVPGENGSSLLRVKFSFVALRGFPSFDDVHRSSGILFVPADASGKADPSNHTEILITEFPPGASAGESEIVEEYGERPARTLGVPSVVVDLRGSLVSSLNLVPNSADPLGGVFSGETQFAMHQLHEFSIAGDDTVLLEYRLGQAWLRAMKAVALVLAQEMPGARPRYLLVGESWGAFGALQAAATHPAVCGVVSCGIPLDMRDFHFARWRRWEREAAYYPLERHQPLAFPDSRAVLSFLSSSFDDPDPGCPTCEAGGDEWLAQYNYLDLWGSGALESVESYFLWGEDDPDLPVDLPLRASVSPAERLSFPGEGEAGGTRGPLADFRRFPYTDAVILRGQTSTLACKSASDAVCAWLQHTSGYRDIPGIRAEESIKEGDVVLDIEIAEGNTTVTGIEVYFLEIDEAKNSDFLHSLHREKPEPPSWRRIDPLYTGHGRGFVQRYRATFPLTRTLNRAYRLSWKDRVGDLEAEHTLPVRTLWYLGDPALGPPRI